MSISKKILLVAFGIVWLPALWLAGGLLCFIIRIDKITPRWLVALFFLTLPFHLLLGPVTWFWLNSDERAALLEIAP